MVGLRFDLTRSALHDAAAARALGERVEDFTATAAARGLGPSSPLALDG